MYFKALKPKMTLRKFLSIQFSDIHPLQLTEGSKFGYVSTVEKEFSF